MNSVRLGVDGTPLTKADRRPIRANCWRCGGLERVWEETNTYSYNNSMECPGCAGTGLDELPWAELFSGDDR